MFGQIDASKSERRSVFDCLCLIVILLAVQSLQVEAYLFKKISYSLSFALVYSALTESAIGVNVFEAKRRVLENLERDVEEHQSLTNQME